MWTEFMGLSREKGGWTLVNIRFIYVGNSVTARESVSLDICSILANLTIRFSCYTTVAAVLCLQSTQNILKQVTLKFQAFVTVVITY
jgi:hypothetical protein